MSDQLEKILKKSMFTLGTFIEKVIGKAKEVKVQTSIRSGVQPILSVESLMDYPKLKELVDLSVNKIMERYIPDLSGKTTLELGEGPAAYGSRLLARQAEMAVAVEIGGGSVGRQGDISRGYIVRSTAQALPFPAESFSYLLARMATPIQGDLSKALSEMGRVLSRGGQGVLVDYHPFGLYTKRGSGKLRPADSMVRRFEDYYRICKAANLRVVDVREVFVDETMRGQFSNEEIQAYRQLKGTPLLVFIFFYKSKK